MENFISEYLRLLEYAEAPEAYLRWGAISCLSAVLRNNVWFLNQATGQRIFPNTYIILLGPSGARKSTAIEKTEWLLGEVGNTKTFSGTATMQGVLKALGTHESGKPEGGSGIILARELRNFFIQDAMTIASLTDMYDFAPKFEKTMGTYEFPTIKELCFSIFGGTNEIMMKTLLDQTAKEGGLLGRTFVIEEKGRRHIDSGMEDHPYHHPDEWIALVAFLRRLNQVKGPIIFDDIAKLRYNQWYSSFKFEEMDTRTGYEARVNTHVIKLAIILSAAKPSFHDLKIHLPELETAIKICENMMQIYTKMTLGSGSAPKSNFMILVTKELMEARNHHLSRMQLMFNLHGNIDGEILDKLMLDLIGSGLVVEKSIGGNPGYKLTPQFWAKYKMNENHNSNSNSAKAD